MKEAFHALCCRANERTDRPISFYHVTSGQSRKQTGKPFGCREEKRTE